MGKIKSVKHSYNAGDLLVLLPGLKAESDRTGVKWVIYQELDFPAFYYHGAYSPIKDDSGQQVCMNREVYSRLKPLLESQAYIQSFDIWEGQKSDMDIARTRDSRFIPMPYGLLHQYAFAIFPELTCDLSIPWLQVTERSVVKDRYADKIIVNRTHRYTNPYISYYFLKDYQDKLLFSGTDEEYATFCSQYNLQIEHLKTDDFLQLAQIISWCKGGLYNQSFHFHLSDALKKHRILELSAQFPNTFPTGANGYGFYHQEALEYHFHNLINKP